MNKNENEGKLKKRLEWKNQVKIRVISHKRCDKERLEQAQAMREM